MIKVFGQISFVDNVIDTNLVSITCEKSSRATSCPDVMSTVLAYSCDTNSRYTKNMMPPMPVTTTASSGITNQDLLAV